MDKLWTARRDADVWTSRELSDGGSIVAVMAEAGDVEVRRSARRSRSVSAYREGSKIIVLIPARLTKAQENRVVADMVERVQRQVGRASRGGAKANDTALMARAIELSRLHLQAQAQPSSVRWVSNMDHRWGSCTTLDATIRVSHRVRSMPSWVLDYVLMHELAHLLKPGHGSDFWSLVQHYPRTERARGYLEGVAAAGQASGADSSPADCPGADCSSADSSAADCSGAALSAADPESDLGLSGLASTEFSGASSSSASPAISAVEAEP